MDNGVIGPRGFIDLEQAMFFCNEDCLKGYCEDISTPTNADFSHPVDTQVDPSAAHYSLRHTGTV